MTVKAQDGRELPFLVCPDTKIAKIARAISNKLSLAPKDFRLCLDGRLLRPWETPKQLGMESGDVIEMLMKMSGD